MDVMAQGAVVLSTFSIAACLATADVRAGDALAPLSEDGRCRALGDGFLAVPGADSCVRISGYVDAGADFDSPLRGARPRGPLQAPTAPVMRTDLGAALDAQVATPMGPARAVIELRGARFGP